jgi:uncharacterized protein YjbI with pentapeptide repeats
MRKLRNEELETILAEHKIWIDSQKKEGKRADLRGANLEDAGLEGANLEGADLWGANL